MNIAQGAPAAMTPSRRAPIATREKNAVSQETRLSNFRLCEVSEYIVTHLDARLSVAQLARTAGYSVSHFTRCLRNSTGLTPRAYVMRQRLCEAEYLVALSTLPLSQIALNTSFSDQSHFTRLFAKRTGITPHALYR